MCSSNCWRGKRNRKLCGAIRQSGLFFVHLTSSICFPNEDRNTVEREQGLRTASLPDHRNVSTPGSPSAGVKSKRVTKEEEEEEEEEETPRSIVPGNVHTSGLKKETSRKPQGQTDNNINAEFGYALMLQSDSFRSLSCSRSKCKQQKTMSSDLLRFAKPCLVLVLLLCLHLHAFDGKAADVPLVLSLQAAFPPEHLRPADSV